MSKLDKEQVLADFTAAFEKANGKAPQVEQKGSWYSVDGGKSLRLAELTEMTTELTGSAPTPAKQEPAKASTDPQKPQSKAPAKARKAKAKTARTSGGLTPKELWKQKLASKDTLPRGVC